MAVSTLVVIFMQIKLSLWVERGIEVKVFGQKESKKQQGFVFVGNVVMNGDQVKVD